MKFNANGIISDVLPLLDKGKSYLSSANSIIYSIAIPEDFSSAATLKTAIPYEISNTIGVINKTKDWLNIKIDDMNDAERKNQQLFSGSKISSSIFNTSSTSSFATGSLVTKSVQPSESSSKSTGAKIVDKGKSIFTDVIDWSKDRLEDIKDVGAEVFSDAKNVVTDKVESFKTYVEDTGAKIVDKGKSIFTDVVDWSKDRLEDLKDIGAVVWKHAKSLFSAYVNLMLSITKGICQFIETLTDLIVMIGAGVASIFTGLYDAYQGIRGAITGEEWSSSTKAMWKGVMGYVAEDHVGNFVADCYKDTALGQWLDSNAYKPFKSDGMACKIGAGVGYVAGLIALCIVTVGAGGAAVSAAAGVSTATASAIVSGVVVGSVTFSSATALTWAGQRDQSWAGIENSYANGEIDQATYDNFKQINNMSDEDWQGVEEAYKNGKITEEDYNSIKSIREMPKEWQTTENLFTGFKEGTKEGVKAAIITMATMGIGGKLSALTTSKIPALLTKIPKGVQPVMGKFFGNVVEETAESAVEYGSGLITNKGSFNKAFESIGGKSGLALSLGLGMLLDVDLSSKAIKSAVNVDLPNSQLVDIDNIYKAAAIKNFSDIQGIHNYDVETLPIIEKAYNGLIDCHGKDNQGIINQAFLDTPIYFAKSGENVYDVLKQKGLVDISDSNNVDQIVGVSELMKASGVHRSIPVIKQINGKFEITDVKRAVVIAGIENVDQLNVTLVHELDHMIKSHSNEYQILGDVLYERSGLIDSVYKLSVEDGVVKTTLISEKGVGLEEGLTALDELNVSKKAFNPDFNGQSYGELSSISAKFLESFEIADMVREVQFTGDKSKLKSLLGNYTYDKFENVMDDAYRTYLKRYSIDLDTIAAAKEEFANIIKNDAVPAWEDMKIAMKTSPQTRIVMDPILEKYNLNYAGIMDKRLVLNEKSLKDIDYSFTNTMDKSLVLSDKAIKDINAGFNKVNNIADYFQKKNFNNEELKYIEEKYELLINEGVKISRGSLYKLALTDQANITSEAANLADSIFGKVTRINPNLPDNINSIEKMITTDMHSTAVDGAHLVGLPHRLKSVDSLARKIQTDYNAPNSELTYDEVAEDISDAVRYTLIVNEDNYASVVKKTLVDLEAKGYEVFKFKNSWHEEQQAYQGINTNLISPDGIKMELQFHTEDSFFTKDTLTHLLYEIGRDETNKANSQIEILVDEISKAYQKKVIVPKDIIGYKYLTDEISKAYQKKVAVPGGIID